MKALTLLFVILIAALQYPLWLGKGSWLRVWDLSRQISEQKDKNAGLKARNDTLDAEVRDLKQGFAAIEERARSELGMVKQDEVFYQIVDQSGMQTPATADVSKASAMIKPNLQEKPNQPEKPKPAVDPAAETKPRDDTAKGAADESAIEKPANDKPATRKSQDADAVDASVP